MPKASSVVEEKWVEEIPPVERSVNGRKSKYDPLLDEVKERADKGRKKAVKTLVFTSPSIAASRAQSVRAAAKRRDDAERYEITTRREELLVAYS